MHIIHPRAWASRVRLPARWLVSSSRFGLAVTPRRSVLADHTDPFVRPLMRHSRKFASKPGSARNGPTLPVARLPTLRRRRRPLHPEERILAEAAEAKREHEEEIERMTAEMEAKEPRLAERSTQPLCVEVPLRLRSHVHLFVGRNLHACTSAFVCKCARMHVCALTSAAPALSCLRSPMTARRSAAEFIASFWFVLVGVGRCCVFAHVGPARRRGAKRRWRSRARLAAPWWL